MGRHNRGEIGGASGRVDRRRLRSCDYGRGLQDEFKKDLAELYPSYTIRQKRKSYFESENNVFTNRFEIENNQNLSKDEENLLEEIIIEDFETRGDLD